MRLGHEQRVAGAEDCLRAGAHRLGRPRLAAVVARMTWMSGPIGVQPTVPVSTQNAIAPG